VVLNAEVLSNRKGNDLERLCKVSQTVSQESKRTTKSRPSMGVASAQRSES
jgi:hypothetical protein